MTESAHEQRVVRLLEEQTRILRSIDIALNDVVAVIEENADKVAGAIDDSTDKIVTAVEPQEEEPVCVRSRKICVLHLVVHGEKE